MSDSDNEIAVTASVPLGQRLKGLEEEKPADIMTEMRSQIKTKKMPKTGSMEVLLSQYLTTNDYNQIENVISVASIKVVKQTIERLDVRFIFPLLDILVMKLEANPRRGSQLLRWIKGVFHLHSSFLMSVPDLSKRVSYLKKLLENRATSFKKILKLRGRLDMVLTRARSVASQDIDFSQALVPLREVNEGEVVTSDEEEEDNMEEEDEIEENDEE